MTVKAPAGAAGESLIRPGLDRIRLALSLSGRPEQSFRAFHVAGTNGKGSTAIYLDALLRRLVSGPVGLYTSPHLVSPRERIRVGGEKIGPADLARAERKAAELSSAAVARTGEPLSWFETMTWAAFDWFRSSRVGVAVLETGLGGRWDATNVCRPIVTIITRIALDHREWLGQTIGAIAAEKAGIVKRGVPCILGRLCPAARRVVVEAAARSGAPTWELGRDFGWKGGPGKVLTLWLPGAVVPGLRIAAAASFQRDNAAVACAAAWRAAEELGFGEKRFAAAVREVLATVRPPGRFEFLETGPGGGAWVDGGHNPDAARALRRELAALDRRIVAVFSMLRDKDARGYARVLRGVVERFVLYPLSHDRAARVEELAAACGAARVRCEEAGDFAQAWRAACLRAGRDGAVVVCGSLVAVGDAFRFLGKEVP